MSAPYIVFDIETGPLPEQDLTALMPEFKAAANLKDPEKIKAQIEDKQRDWLESAALSPESGQVLAIGYKYSDAPPQIATGDESEMLKAFWDHWISYWTSYEWVGHNVVGFDFPFMVRRSWILGITVPKSVTEMTANRHPHVEDTMLLWSLGSREDRISLDRLGKLLKVGQKNGSGKDFAKLLKEDKAKAEEYLNNDLALTEKVYLRLRSN